MILQLLVGKKGGKGVGLSENGALQEDISNLGIKAMGRGLERTIPVNGNSCPSRFWFWGVAQIPLGKNVIREFRSRSIGKNSLLQEKDLCPQALEL